MEKRERMKGLSNLLNGNKWVWADQIKEKALVAMEMVFSCGKKKKKKTGWGILSCAAMS
jgi:hypothetical protein